MVITKRLWFEPGGSNKSFVRKDALRIIVQRQYIFQPHEPGQCRILERKDLFGEDQFDQQQKIKEDELIKKFYSDQSSEKKPNELVESSDQKNEISRDEENKNN